MYIYIYIFSYFFMYLFIFVYMHIIYTYIHMCTHTIYVHPLEHAMIEPEMHEEDTNPA